MPLKNKPLQPVRAGIALPRTFFAARETNQQGKQ